jgi:hypothetical protein
MSALRQQERRAKLVRFFSNHCEEERLRTIERLPTEPCQTPVCRRRAAYHNGQRSALLRALLSIDHAKSATRTSRRMRDLTSQNS